MRKGLIPGLIFIGLGLYTLAINFGFNIPNMGNLWPVFPCLLGLVLLFEALIKNKDAIFPGTMFLMVGVFFFMFTLDFVPWSEMSRLWPAFPAILGFSFLMLYFVKLEWGLLIPTGIFLGTGFLFFAINYGYLNEAIFSYIWKLWPVLLILLGISLLFGRSSKEKVDK